MTGEGTVRRHPGYKVLVKLKVDELLAWTGSGSEVAATSREGLTGVEVHGTSSANRPREPYQEEPV